jgi:hypothetical protein
MHPHMFVLVLTLVADQLSRPLFGGNDFWTGGETSEI